MVILSSCGAFGPFFLLPSTFKTKALGWLTLRRKKIPQTPACFPLLDTDKRPLGSSDTLTIAIINKEQHLYSFVINVSHPDLIIDIVLQIGGSRLYPDHPPSVPRLPRSQPQIQSHHFTIVCIRLLLPLLSFYCL